MENRFASQFPKTTINQILKNRYVYQVKQPKNKIQVTYAWIDGTEEFLRAKTRTLGFVPKDPSEIPIWNYCGSATFQATGNLAEMRLYPRALYPNPFLAGNNKLVLCDTYTFDDVPGKGNNRRTCEDAMKKVSDQHPWFGVEQKYTVLNTTDQRPLGWPKRGYPGPEGPSYCGVGANKVFGRHIEEAHYRACLYAGIRIGGTNAEVAPSQWKFKIGPCEGIDAGDQLWTARYLLHRVAEEYGVTVTFDPALMALVDRKSSRVCYTFSTAAMRREHGISAIVKTTNKLLSEQHTRSITACQPQGRKEDKYNSFADDVGTSTSIHIPWTDVTKKEGCVRECRPASNCDPYRVSELIVRTVCLDE